VVCTIKSWLPALKNLKNHSLVGSVLDQFAMLSAAKKVHVSENPLIATAVPKPNVKATSPCIVRSSQTALRRASAIIRRRG
jgi:hypothetical protein